MSIIGRHGGEILDIDHQKVAPGFIAAAVAHPGKSKAWQAAAESQAEIDTRRGELNLDCEDLLDHLPDLTAKLGPSVITALVKVCEL